MASRQEARHLDLSLSIIPMAGVALIVVLMMMMTATQLLTHEDTPVLVPPANTMERKTEENLTIALIPDVNNPESDRKLYLNDSLMTLQGIERRVQQKMSEDPYYLVVIRADKSVPSQWVMELLSMAKTAGAQRVALSTKRQKEEEATEGS